MISARYGIAVSLVVVAIASGLASCGGGGGGSTSSGSSASSSSTVTASYTAQDTVTLMSLSTSEMAPTIAAPVTLSDGTLMVPSVQKNANLWNLQVQAFNDHSAPTGNPVVVTSADTSGFVMSERVLLPMSGGGLVAVQGSNVSDHLVFQRVAYGASAGSADFSIPVSGGAQRFMPLKNNSFAVIFNDSATFTAAGKFTPSVQFYDALTGMGGTPFLIPANWATDHTDGFAAPLSTGGFVVSWCDQCYSSAYNPPFTLSVQTYDDSGQALISPVSVAVGSGGNPITDGQVFGLRDGGFGVIWNESTAATSGNVTPNAVSTKIRFRLYHADGTPATAVLTLGPATGTRQFQAVAVLSTGRIAVLWSTIPVSALGRSTPDYRVDVVDTSGAQVGTSVAVATPSDTSVSQGSLVARPNGGMAVLWQETVLGFCMPCRQNMRLLDPK